MASDMTTEEILAAIDRVPRWRHTIEVAPGITTPGGPTHRVLRRIGLPTDLAGKSVLDIGCSDGFFAFECEKRGAARVVAIDDWSSPFVDGPEGLRTAHAILHSKVEVRNMDLQTLDPGELGEFDVVLCLGVLYHLRFPFLGMERLAQLTRGVLHVETEVSESIINRPVLTFIEGLYRGRDITTWWVPSISCVQQMARAAGFQRVETVKIYDTRAVFRCHKDSEALVQEICSYPSEEIAAAAKAQDAGALQAALRAMPWSELQTIRQRLVWKHSSRIAQSRRAVSIPYGAFRRLLSGLSDALRVLRLRYR